jgi:NADPH:quinone reductase-like Zn-dependent oxidoreductase
MLAKWRGCLISAIALTVGVPVALAQEVMRVVEVPEYGAAEVLRVAEVPRPVAGRGEVLIRVHAAGVNPVDTQARRGEVSSLVGATLPYVPGFDVSGVIEAVGDGVEGYRPGDEVFAHLDLRRGGGYAEYVVAPIGEVARKPVPIDHREAASLPLVALTVWQGLIEVAELEPGQAVLIHGGAGGVGSIAVQVARWRGARVIATASPRNHDFLRELGVDQVIDYGTERFEDIVRDVDVILDTVGGETQERSLGVVREGGILVSIVGLTPAARSTNREIRVRSILVRPDAEQLEQIGTLVEEGELRPIVSHVFSLDRAAEAHLQSETRSTRGKIVLEVIGG